MTGANDIFAANQGVFDANFNFSGSPTPKEVVSPHDVDFNPFEDVPSEFFKPFMSYATIPPPDNFKANGVDTDFFAASPPPKNTHYDKQLNSSSTIESDDSEQYEHLVSQQSSKSLVQNFLNEMKLGNSSNNNINHPPLTPSNLAAETFKKLNENNILMPMTAGATTKRPDAYKIENMSNSDMSDSPMNEDFNDYFK